MAKQAIVKNEVWWFCASNMQTEALRLTSRALDGQVCGELKKTRFYSYTKTTLEVDNVLTGIKLMARESYG